MTYSYSGIKIRAEPYSLNKCEYLVKYREEKKKEGKPRAWDNAEQIQSNRDFQIHGISIKSISGSQTKDSILKRLIGSSPRSYVFRARGRRRSSTLILFKVNSTSLGEWSTRRLRGKERNSVLHFLARWWRNRKLSNCNCVIGDASLFRVWPSPPELACLFFANDRCRWITKRGTSHRRIYVCWYNGVISLSSRL